MSGHEIVGGRLRRYPGGWAADCTCTWIGPIRAARLDAAEEWHVHVVQAVTKESATAAARACAA